MDSDQIREIIISLFAVDSVWSVVFRGGIWFAIAMVIILSTDSANAESSGSLKRNLGFFLLFIMLSGGLIYLLFGFSATSTVAATTAQPL